MKFHYDLCIPLYHVCVCMYDDVCVKTSYTVIFMNILLNIGTSLSRIDIYFSIKNSFIKYVFYFYFDSEEQNLHFTNSLSL